MSRTDTPWRLPDRTVARYDEADREIRISDFALMALLPVRSVAVGGFPLNEFAMAALVFLCLFRPARGAARLSSPVVVLFGALLALLTYSGLTNDIDWTRRIGHLVIMAGIIWAGGTGRLSLRSVGAGLAAGIITVIALALAGVGGDAYPGRLTGFLGDPNAGAYFLAVLGTLAIFFCDERTKVRVAVAAPIIMGLVLCYSRTGLLAAAFVLVWISVGRRLGQVTGAALAVGLIWVVNNIPKSLTTLGPFSDRSGSDKLRERIIAQERVELATAPWYGHGPGTATVDIRDLEFYFHNSYLATRQEGGWIALLLILGLMGFVFVTMATRARQGDLVAAGTQGALIGVGVMGITLGEVFLDTPMAVAVALALGHSLRVEEEQTADG